MTGSKYSSIPYRFNALIVSPTPTHPTDQGNRKRIYHVCEELQKRGGCIHFLYFPREWAGKIELDAYNSMKEKWEYFHIVPPHFPPPYKTNKDHWDIDDWYDDALGIYIGWLCASISFDLAIVNYAFLSKALCCLPEKTLKVLDTHDRLSGRKDLLTANNLEPEFFYTIEKEEAIALERADLVLAIKDEERLFFQKITQKPVLTLGFIESPGFISVQENSSKKIRIGFLGSGNGINRENLKRFLDCSREILFKDNLNIEIVIAGSISSYFYENLPWVKILGPLDNVSTFYESIDVCVMPFEFSTGLKIKVLEGLSYGLPIIGTKNAFEGIETLNEFHQFTTINELVQYCVTLHDHQELLVKIREECNKIYSTIKNRVDHSFDLLVKLIRKNVLIIPTRDFYLENTPRQQRISSIIRSLSRCANCIILYPYFIDLQNKKKLTEWQWETKNYFLDLCENSDCVDLRKINSITNELSAEVVVLLSLNYSYPEELKLPTIIDVGQQDSNLENLSEFPFPIAITSNSFSKSAFVSGLLQKAFVYPVPELSPNKPRRKMLKEYWILSNCLGNDFETIKQVSLFLCDNVHNLSEVKVHLITKQLPVFFSGIPHIHVYSLQNIDIDKLPSPDIVIDLINFDSNYDKIRKHGLLLKALFVVMKKTPDIPRYIEIPGLEEISIFVNNTASLLSACYVLIKSSRTRALIQKKINTIIKTWYGPDGLRSFEEFVKGMMTSKQAKEFEKILKENSNLEAVISAKEFDESFYLSRNNDVLLAINHGVFKNGYEHFAKYGQYEGRHFRKLRSSKAKAI